MGKIDLCKGDIDLGDVVITHSGKGIVCGWNGGCNFDIYLFEKEEIYNIHPNDINGEDLCVGG